MGKPIQEKLFDSKLDVPIVKAADEYTDLMDEQNEIKKRLSAAQSALIIEMNKSRREKIRHQGRIFEIVSSNPRQKIRVKKEKAEKKKKSSVRLPLDLSSPPATPSINDVPAPAPTPKRNGKARNSKLAKNELKLHQGKK